MKTSVIILNHNYGRFVGQAIQSCLDQDHPDVETIVVDDGSTDDSRDVIGAFGDAVTAIYQPNRGMIEASNAGFAASTGDVVFFLDADDWLSDSAVSRVVSHWQSDLSKVHYRVETVSAEGEHIGFIPPRGVTLSRGDVWLEIAETGTCTSPPTSGNAFARTTLEQLFPIEDAKVNSTGTYYDYVPTDSYLKLRAPFFGPVVAIDDPLAFKRLHGENNKGKSPYVNVLKRHRHMRLARLNAGFIREHLPEGSAHWDEDVLFAKEKLIRLRMLSLRFDEAHPWPEDSRLGLLRVHMRNGARGRPSRALQRVKGLMALTLIGVLPKRAALGLLLAKEERRRSNR